MSRKNGFVEEGCATDTPRKRILIVNNNMHIGGVQKALVNLLKEIASEYEVTLLLFYKGGELLRDVPENVRIITACRVLRGWGATREDAGGLRLQLSRAFSAAITRAAGRKWICRILFPFQKKLRGYDVAISYLHSGNDHVFYGGCNEFVLRCTEAEKKISFLHCDYEKMHAGSRYNASIYQKFDAIAACSAGCREAFLAVFPELKQKVQVVRNCHDYKRLQQDAAQAPVVLPKTSVNVLTVSRFGREKGVLRGVQAAADLQRAGKRLRYFIIGNGAEYPQAAAMVKQLGLETSVTLLGEMLNPYGYLKAADVLLIPSFSEAAPMVIGEAASLGTPVLSTRTSSAEEMILCSGYGWVCDNTQVGITEGLERLLANPEILKSHRESLEKMEFTNSEAITEFRHLIS